MDGINYEQKFCKHGHGNTLHGAVSNGRFMVWICCKCSLDEYVKLTTFEGEVDGHIVAFATRECE